MNRSRLGRIRWVSLFLLTMAAGLAVGGRVASAQDPAVAAPRAVSVSAAALAQAQALYDGSDFTGAQALLREKLAAGVITGGEVRPARELLARSLVRSGNRVEAKEAFKALIRKFSGYRPSAGTMPPDEQDVFAMAEREVLDERIAAGKQIPASLAFYFGTGSADNEDMQTVVQRLGTNFGVVSIPQKYEGKNQIGGAVRFPIRQRLSVDIEIQSLRASTSMPLPSLGNRQLYFDVSATPISVSLYQTVLSGRSYRINLFAGGGVLATALSEIDYRDLTAVFGIPLKISGQKNGSYFHGGLETEYLVTRRLALSGRIAGRSAKAKGTLDEIGVLQEFQDRTVDFSGYGATLGLRAYIGY